MILKRAAIAAGLTVSLVFASCTCSRDAAKDKDQPSSGQAKGANEADQGLVITAEAGKTEGKGETRPYVEPVLPEFVGGSLSQRAIAGEITAHVEELRACYQKGLEAKPDLQGSITLMFLLGDDGAVTGCEVRESALSHEPTDRCICDAVRTWKFPKPRAAGGVKVLYTFVLRP